MTVVRPIPSSFPKGSGACRAIEIPEVLMRTKQKKRGLTVGLSKTTGTKNTSRQRLVAYHEAGHATMAAMLDDYDAVTKVTKE